jgi:peptidoglycan/LPS O-acetylase OafA/YrhL
MKRNVPSQHPKQKQEQSQSPPPPQQHDSDHFHHHEILRGRNEILTTAFHMDYSNTTSTSITTTAENISNSSNVTLEVEPQPQLQVLPETTAYWSRDPYAWSSTSIQQPSPQEEEEERDGENNIDYHHRHEDSSKPRHSFANSLSLPPPLLTSSKCSKAFYDVFRNTYYSDIGNIDIEQPNFLLSIIVESCSHPSGLNALYAQPYMYAGPGLGNIDICPLQTCIAGNGNPPQQPDSISFASICIVPECTAYDLGAEDFVAAIARQYDAAIQPETPIETIDLGREYILLLRRISEINKFLKTGWSCGDFVVPFDRFPFGLPYVILCGLFVLLSVIGTIRCHLGRQQQQEQQQQRRRQHLAQTITTNTGAAATTTTRSVQPSMVPPQPIDPESSALLVFDPSINGNSTCSYPGNGHLSNTNGVHRSSSSSDTETKSLIPTKTWSTREGHWDDGSDSVWSAFNVRQHIRRLTQPPLSPVMERTVCLDGLRVGSTLWIILGHVLAIQSSSGAGYSNPSNFLPPTGLTTTFIGQLLFSSRYAVDTFFTISGYLVVHGICRLQQNRIPSDVAASWWKNVVVRYITTIPLLLLTRVGRILPLYAMSLGFFTQIAPHMGNGPFWHQWINLLQPCHDYIWTNFLFINNLIPLQTPTTSTCFYHSWYIAVDMQLFIVAPFLVFWYQYSKWQGQIVACILFFASVMITAYWSYVRQWSVNTFDGSIVNRYDVEAYANPIVRAQAYLAGMYVAFIINNRNDRRKSGNHQRTSYGWIHRAVMAATLTLMFALTFITVTGAYARRPCTYEEDPFSNICGSTWSTTGTFVYTAFGRTAWIIGISIILFLCIGRGEWNDGEGNLVAFVLSWSCWRPLSHLSFGAYLIHPIVVFVWQLGDREKQVFRLLTFGMDYISVCVVSFVAAMFASVLVECPCALLLKKLVQIQREKPKRSLKTLATTMDGKHTDDANEFSSTDSTPISISPLSPTYENYGSLMLPTSALHTAPIDRTCATVSMR